MKYFISIIIIILSCSGSSAQQTGEIDYPYLGIRFTIPTGWKGAESNDGFLIGSDTKPGLIFMMPHDVKNLETLKREAEGGIQDEGVSLSKSGEFESVGSGGVGAEFAGLIQGQSAKAFVVGVINPFGSGVTIIAATSSDQYSTEFKDLAVQLAMSLKFAEPTEPPVTQQWRESLNGAKLTYLNSSYSSGGSVDGYSTYSGYSSRNEITLCPDGTFRYYSSSSMSIDTGGAFAGGGGNNNGTGTWQVNSDGQGTPVLKLQFQNGEMYSYKLSYENSKTYLNGSRYFRTYDATCN